MAFRLLRAPMSPGASLQGFRRCRWKLVRVHLGVGRVAGSLSRLQFVIGPLASRRTFVASGQRPEGDTSSPKRTPMMQASILHGCGRRV